ncbi:hypothetical protein C5167_012784 [Papaver somniferum]|uniref:Uncharacterized protein n=1 Tax=Papaver somniferum TaxID=3469 RepID=A0A4Y7J2H5_PAPSO|nr:hypothetical protein C5167_012784 [Papaver somniferum]
MQTSKPVQKLDDGEERFLKDLQFGSIDWSKLRPPASCHETEEDSLSITSIVEYDYTEDQYPNEDEEDKVADAKYPTEKELAAMVADLESRHDFSYRVSPNLCPKDEWIASWKVIPATQLDLD